MFLIIETVENNEPLCTAVPESWIKKNDVLWPQNLSKQKINFARMHALEPQADWKATPCKILFKNITTFKEALQKEKLATEFSNSEDEASFKSQQAYKRKHPIIFNDMFSDYENDTDISNTPMKKKHADLEQIFECDEQDKEPIGDLMLVEPTYYGNLETTTSQIIQEIKEPDINKTTSNCNCNLDKLNKKMDIFIEEVRKERQERLNFEVGVQGTLELILKKMSEIKNNQTKQDDCRNEEYEYSFPMTTPEELDQMDEKLGNEKEFNSFIIRKLSIIGGVDYKSNLRNICKTMFKDALLASYTWKGTNCKKSFKHFSNVLNVLYFSTRKNFQFSDLEGNNFIKEYLKHAPARAKR